MVSSLNCLVWSCALLNLLVSALQSIWISGLEGCSYKNLRQQVIIFHLQWYDVNVLQSAPCKSINRVKDITFKNLPLILPQVLQTRVKKKSFAEDKRAVFAYTKLWINIPAYSPPTEKAIRYILAKKLSESKLYVILVLVCSSSFGQYLQCQSYSIARGNTFNHCKYSNRG